MATISRLFTLIALAAAAAPIASATSCGNNQFQWGNLCITLGGSLSVKGTAPSGKSCPSNWFWHTEASCCTPSTPSAGSSTSCSNGFLWSAGEQCCKASTSTTATPTPTASTGTCGNNEFPWTGKAGQCCLPNGGTGTTPPAPTGTSCPSSWYWHSGQSCCVPKSPQPSTPQCSNGWLWSGWWCSPPGTPTTSSTPPSSTSSCSSGQFSWVGLKGDCCIPLGGHPSPPSPPSGSSCPSNWWWHEGQGCCVPSNPSPPTPTCSSNWIWQNQCCSSPKPQPSGHYKRKLKKRTSSYCPVGLEACPVGGILGAGSDYECLDTARELQSCGGCSSIHPELDCTTIEGSWNVGCEKGTCRVYSCMAGYKISSDYTSCEKL